MTENTRQDDHADHLTATLGLGSVTLFGLAYMTPIIVLGIFGIIATESEGASAGAYMVATLAMLFTAASYAKMSQHYPVAGSSYTYAGDVPGGVAGSLSRAAGRTSGPASADAGSPAPAWSAARPGVGSGPRSRRTTAGG